MKSLKFGLIVLLAAAFAFAAVRLLPRHWFRQSGLLDLAVVVDVSGSYRDQLPMAIASTTQLLAQVLPGDRLAVFAVGPEIIELARSAVSPELLRVLGPRVAALRTAVSGGTALGDALTRVAAVLGEFATARSPTGSHRRMIVLFSDCIGEPAGAVDFKLPGSASVLVVGFRGQKRDAVTMALVGDGSNDVHIISPGESGQAIESLISSLDSQAHPLIWFRVAAGLLACLVLSAGVIHAIARLVARGNASMTVRLMNPRESDSAQEFTLAHEGASISIGSSDQFPDFAIPATAHCSIVRAGRGLLLHPGAGELWLRGAGDPRRVAEPCPVAPGDSILIAGLEVAVGAA